MFYEKDNLKLHYKVIGEGKPIILLHGLACHMKLMENCMESVFKNKNYKRIYVDLPGMGKSQVKTDSPSSDFILESLVSFIEFITDENFLLAGESYGGYIARGILVKMHERVDGMLLVCPVAVPEYGKRDLPVKNIEIFDENFLEKLDKEERRKFSELAVIADERTYKRYVEDIKEGNQVANMEFIKKLLEKYKFSFEPDELLRKIRFENPVLFIVGRQDNIVGYRDLGKLSEDYPRGSYSVIDTAGHNLQTEQPEIFECLVKDWIKRVEINLKN